MNLRRWGLLAVAGAGVLLCPPAWASKPGETKGAAVPRDHAIPSCYEQWRDLSQVPRALNGDLTVVIDQTTFLDARMRQIVSETVERLLRPGIQVSIVSFSAFLPGRYLDVLVSGRIEAPVSGKQRDYVPKRQLLQSDQCLEEQMAFARRLIGSSLDASFAAADVTLARSDILAALHDIGRRIGDASADNRMVLIVSDMMENSSITSFYRAGQLRVVDAEAELKLVARSGIRTDFRGARVFVIGAGLGLSRPVAAGQGIAYRDPRAMLALEDFWRRWFAASNGELVEFGKPTPLVQIKWPAGGQAR
jgi:fructose-specific component phosphotransferase system IIB-like protein